ncbi:MAG: DUF2784 family protein [Streptosporangiales bacterium]|nr:DUF2784 family protein [Streptosporangiales bacterium]
MGYRVLAEAAMVVHFLFLVYLLGGGYVAWRWPRLVWPHLAAGAWGFAAITFGVACPLTSLEDWSRRSAGGEGLATGFVDTYIEGVIYPESWSTAVRVLVLVVVAVSWLGLVMRLHTRRLRGP